MKRLVTLFLFTLLFSFSLTAQTPSVECDMAEVICDFDDLVDFTFTMNADNSPGEQPLPLCPDGGAPDNILWLGFIAHEGDYELKLFGDNCSGSTTGIEGLQYGIYSDCSFANAITCNPDCSLDTLSVSSDLLDPGMTYYMFVDGCSGSVCDISVQIDGSYEGEYCGTTSTTDVSQSTLDPKVIIYPNPSSERININSVVEFNEVVFYNVRGEIVKQLSMNNLMSELNVSVAGLDRGFYFLSLINGDRVVYSKLLLE